MIPAPFSDQEIGPQLARGGTAPVLAALYVVHVSAKAALRADPGNFDTFLIYAGCKSLEGHMAPEACLLYQRLGRWLAEQMVRLGYEPSEGRALQNAMVGFLRAHQVDPQMAGFFTM